MKKIYSKIQTGSKWPVCIFHFKTFEYLCNSTGRRKVWMSVCVCGHEWVVSNGVVYCRRPFVSTFGRRHTNFVPTFQPPSFRTGLPTVAVTLYLVPAFRPPSFVTTFFITEIFWALVVASPLRRLLESQSSPSGLGPVRLLDRPANQAAISRPPPRTA
jgi:hypothetical protein